MVTMAAVAYKTELRDSCECMLVSELSVELSTKVIYNVVSFSQ